MLIAFIAWMKKNSLKYLFGILSNGIFVVNQIYIFEWIGCIACFVVSNYKTFCLRKLLVWLSTKSVEA